MNGIINVLKPPGMTSHDVINFLRRLLMIKKIGHSGTLDPAAAGVLPTFVGRATKAIEFFIEDDKEYIAEIALGITTDTGDYEGQIVNTCSKKIDRLQLEDILKEFVGEIKQIPPMFSSVRYKGKKLYELARKGISVERKPRKVKIISLNLLDYDTNKAIIKVKCSKVHYIRTLCEDIGNRLGVGACLSCLIRTRSGPFSIEKSFTLEEIKDNVSNDKLKNALISVDSCLEDMPAVRLNCRENESFFAKGKFLPGDYNYLNNLIGQYVKVYNFDRFVGIAAIEKNQDKITLRLRKSFF